MTIKHMRVARVAALGVLVALLYWLLFIYEGQILELTSQGKWFFVVPVGIALVFSLIHGTFTGYFWDVLGLKAKNN